MTYNYEKIGARLKDLREHMGYSLEKVAEACNVQQYQTVSNWEKGNTFPSLEKLLKLCEIYGCELGYLLGEYDCKTRRNADIKAITGLNEKAIQQLEADNAFYKNSIKAINEILIFQDGNILKDISNFLFYRFDGEIDAGNVKINGNNIADAFLLEIIGEMRALRKKLNGGNVNGNN